MKRQIRRGTFETNSSSTHAICISQMSIDENDLPAHIRFDHGEFGWEFEIYEDVPHKASYLYQAIWDVYYGDVNARDDKLKLLSSTLSRYGIECEFEEVDEYNADVWAEGYIDHGDEAEEFVEAIFESEGRLLRYLFGKSKVITGSDNGDAFGDYMDSHDFSDYEVFHKGN